MASSDVEYDTATDYASSEDANYPISYNSLDSKEQGGRNLNPSAIGYLFWDDAKELAQSSSTHQIINYALNAASDIAARTSRFEIDAASKQDAVRDRIVRTWQVRGPSLKHPFASRFSHYDRQWKKLSPRKNFCNRCQKALQENGAAHPTPPADASNVPVNRIGNGAEDCRTLNYGREMRPFLQVSSVICTRCYRGTKSSASSHNHPSWCRLSRRNRELQWAVSRDKNADFCKDCRRALRLLSVPQRRTFRYTVMKVLKASPVAQEHECELCRLFIESHLGRCGEDGGRRAFQSLVTYFIGGWEDPGRQLARSFTRPNEQNLEFPSSMFTCASFLDLAYPTPANRLYSLSTVAESSTASPIVWKLAHTWLTKCIESHADCSKGNYWSLPTRLIDVGVRNSPNVHLVEKKDITLPARYMTLSHCWGGYMPYKLSMSNITETKSLLHIYQLSPNFQDATLITRYFGVRYLWIDSLCIIQDSSEDWSLESAQMSSIYANSYCNLVGTAFSNGSQGLFVRRNPATVTPLRLDFGTTQCHLESNKRWREDLELGPLSKRAWAFQERALSPRNLHFLSSQVFWECDSCSRCETYPNTWVEASRYRPSDPRITYFPGTFEGDPTPRFNPRFNKASSKEELYEIWGSLIGEYSAKRLTKASDRLVAISGIAYKFFGKLQDEYLAGAWRTDLLRQLLWRSIDRHHPKVSEYVAPSWSWASAPGKVSMIHMTGMSTSREYIQVLEAEARTSLEAPFGQVHSGFLRVIGTLFQASLTHGGSGNPGSLSGTIVYSSGRAHNHFCSYIGDKLYGTRDFGAPSTLIGSEHRAKTVSEAVYCLPILSILSRSPSSPELSGTVMLGLFLKPTWKNIGEFERLGDFHMAETPQIHEELNNFVAEPMGLGLSVVQKEDGSAWHQITIV